MTLRLSDDQPVPVTELMTLFQDLPPMGAEALRADLDRYVDADAHFDANERAYTELAVQYRDTAEGTERRAARHAPAGETTSHGDGRAVGQAGGGVG